MQCIPNLNPKPNPTNPTSHPLPGTCTRDAPVLSWYVQVDWPIPQEYSSKTNQNQSESILTLILTRTTTQWPNNDPATRPDVWQDKTRRMTRQDKTKQDKAKQDKTRQDKTIQDKTRQDQPKQDQTRQDKTRQDKTRQDKARQDKTRQSKTRARQGKHALLLVGTVPYNTTIRWHQHGLTLG